MLAAMYARGQASMAAIAGMTDDADGDDDDGDGKADRPSAPAAKTTIQPSRKRPALKAKRQAGGSSSGKDVKGVDDDGDSDITPIHDMSRIKDALSQVVDLDDIFGPVGKAARVTTQQAIEHRVTVVNSDFDTTVEMRRAKCPEINDPKYSMSQLLNPPASHVIWLFRDHCFHKHKFKLFVNTEDARCYSTVLVLVRPQTARPVTRMTMNDVKRMQDDGKEVRHIQHERERDDEQLKHATVNRLGDFEESQAMHAMVGFILLFMRVYGVPRVVIPGPEYLATVPAKPAAVGTSAAAAAAAPTVREFGGHCTYLPHAVFHVDAFVPIPGAPSIPWGAAPVPHAANTASRVAASIRDDMRKKMKAMWNDHDLCVRRQDIEVLDTDSDADDD